MSETKFEMKPGCLSLPDEHGRTWRIARSGDMGHLQCLQETGRNIRTPQPALAEMRPDMADPSTRAHVVFEEAKVRLAELEADVRIRYTHANLFNNPILCIELTGLRTEANTLRRVLGLPFVDYQRQAEEKTE